MSPRWIDYPPHLDAPKVGDVLFLRETFDTSKGTTSWSATRRPCVTNRSGEPTLHGWCGETNNKSLYARGLVRVVTVAVGMHGDPRLRIARISRGARQAEALEAKGYHGEGSFSTHAGRITLRAKEEVSS